MPSKERNKYKGSLNKPIRVPTYKTKRRTCREIVTDAPQQDEVERKAHTENNTLRYGTEFLEKMPLLFAHYGIADSPDKWMHLAFRLARDHVPGFRLESEKSRGRKLEKDENFLLQLYLDVERKRISRNGRIPSIAEACEALSKKHPNYKKDTQKTLQHLYTKSKSSLLVKLYNSAKKMGLDEAMLVELLRIR